MNASDQEKLLEALQAAWPDKFTPSDCAYWVQELADFELDDVVAAITAQKADSLFRPKLSQVKFLVGQELRKRGKEHAANRPTRHPFAVAVITSNPAAAKLSDAEIIMRHQRALWCRRHKGIVESAAARQRDLTPGETDNLTQLAAFLVREQASNLAEVMKFDRATAERYLSTISGDQRDFDLALNELRGMISNQTTIADEVPEFA